MKRVLIISYGFHGTPRMLGLAKYLPEFGWQPVILTITRSEKVDSRLIIIETPYSHVLSFWKRLVGLDPEKNVRSQIKNRFSATSGKSLLDFFLTRCAEIIHYPDAYKGWRAFAIKAAEDFLQKENVDAMISSSFPVISHIIAKELKIKYRIPWVADFRDLWSQNHNYYYGTVRHFFDRRLELKTLLPADVLVTVSQLWGEKLRGLHRGKPTYWITNGFDPGLINTPGAKLTTKFTVTYTGRIYQGKQEPSKLLAVLRDLISEGAMDPDNIEVRFYGPNEKWLEKEFRDYGLANIAKQYGIVPRQVVFNKQRESQLLLLLNWDDKPEKGWYPLKIFEYLAARRPILAVGGYGDDVVTEMLDETKAGFYGSTVEQVKNIIKDLYSEYKLKGSVSYVGDMEKIKKYSHREMARKFAELLNGLNEQ